MLIREMVNIVGKEYVFSSGEIMPDYAKDHSLHKDCPFEILVKPASPEEISAILQICCRFNIPVTPRGGGTGVTGGALPVKGGVVLSLERMDRILSIDVPNRYAIVETGVITEIFCDAVTANGMYYPVVPGSKGSSFIGGNLALNAGSPKSCRYGTTKDFVLNLQVVLSSGEIIWTGANVYKNSTGFNLTQLFIGSEGVLGIITKAVLKLLPRPASTKLLLAGFRNTKDACNASLALSRFATRPSAVELITESAISLTTPYLPEKYPLLYFPVKAHLLVEWEGFGDEDPDAVITGFSHLIGENDPVDILMGSTIQEMDLLWSLRRRIDTAMTNNGWLYRDIDACVPPDRVNDYLEMTGHIGKKNGRELISFGHVMDGNIHTMLLIEKEDIPENRLTEKVFLQEIYSAALSLGGTISGEHGIGCLQQEFLPLQLSERHLSLLRQIKSVFDPSHILNPGKLLLDRSP
ncbi:FAD-binding oxidoreductase [Flavitalea flava]